jgi:hypothetical protein
MRNSCIPACGKRYLPDETRFLESFDRFRAGVEAIVDMPERTLDNLFGFLRQNGGRLSRRATENEFAELTPQELRRIEGLYADAFERGERANAQGSFVEHPSHLKRR